MTIAHTRRANTMHGVCATFAIVSCIKPRRSWFAATVKESIIHRVFVTIVGNSSIKMTSHELDGIFTTWKAQGSRAEPLITVT